MKIMAGLTATRMRLVPWLKLKLQNKSVCVSSAHTFCEKMQNVSKFSSDLRPLIPWTVTTSGVSSHKHFFKTHKRLWSSSSAEKLDVPQVDLESEQQLVENSVNVTKLLQNLSPEDARKLKIIKLEFDVMEQMYSKVPEQMTDENWWQALQLDSKSKRMRYYTYLRRIELTKKSKQRKQMLRQQQKEEQLPVEEKERVSKNTIFFMIRESAVKKAGSYRLAHAMQFGQPLVFDLDYEQYMRHQDCQNLVNQLLMCYSKNRDFPEPFHFMFTSLGPNSKAFRMLQKAQLTGLNFMGTMTEKSYLDLFPKERLVYLSPHASEPLREVNCDDVYIIGGIVDKTHPKPLSLAKAKEQGIRTVKFPLDQYLLWGMGSKSLTLDQVVEILLEQRRSKDWNKAFTVIPKRKLYRDGD